MLVNKHGSMASLCERLGYARNETATLTRILNANIRHDRGGEPYNMGSPMARKIEEKLSLGLGWMDTPPSYAELHGEEDPRAEVMQLMVGDAHRSVGNRGAASEMRLRNLPPPPAPTASNEPFLSTSGDDA